MIHGEDAHTPMWPQHGKGYKETTPMHKRVIWRKPNLPCVAPIGHAEPRAPPPYWGHMCKSMDFCHVSLEILVQGNASGPNTRRNMYSQPSLFHCVAPIQQCIFRPNTRLSMCGYSWHKVCSRNLCIFMCGPAHFCAWPRCDRRGHQ